VGPVRYTCWSAPSTRKMSAPSRRMATGRLPWPEDTGRYNGASNGVNRVLWRCFNRLVRPAGWDDVQEWDAVRWRPLAVQDGQIVATSLCGRFSVRFDFETNMPGERANRSGEVRRVVIRSTGPIEMA